MKYLVEIMEEVENISRNKQKIQNDPLNGHSYEKNIWASYRKIT